MRSLEGGGWKSAKNGNSLATYPTASPVLLGRDYSDIVLLPNHSPALSDYLGQRKRLAVAGSIFALSAIALLLVFEGRRRKSVGRE
ncbi:hypothetical protein N0Y54_30785 [Nostoc punctiforme UO1]|uniref:hypothetical protein n=1 Tax=Nostoc punctiforme TaxID=272131 RepID=UPI003097E367